MTTKDDETPPVASAKEVARAFLRKGVNLPLAAELVPAIMDVINAKTRDELEDGRAALVAVLGVAVSLARSGIGPCTHSECCKGLVHALLDKVDVLTADEVNLHEDAPASVH